MATLTGSADRIVFRNAETGFCVARFQLAEIPARGAAAATLVGTMPAIKVGEMLCVTGEWELHPVHGRNFRVERCEQELPDTPEGIERYLGSGAIRGIGPVTASRIVDAFGERAIAVIEDSPDELRRIQGISEKRLTV